jgi:Asp-tRNA(Asn)/Glu-tRNA(Gln) amidotransferase A subunit family amidase
VPFRVKSRAEKIAMLSLLDLLRRIEDGSLTAAKVIDLCAEAIAAQEKEIGAFASLDVAGARRQAKSNAEPCCAACLSA